MEREILRWLAESFPAAPPVELGIGDDAAVVRFSGERTRAVLTTDAIVDGVHFDLQRHAWEQVGRKSIAVNLSDLAAKGARPVAVLVTLVLPRSTTLPQVQALYAGIREICDQFQTQIIGGDTNVGPGPLVISTTAIGTLTTGQTGWRLSGARPNDAILVSGDLGGSILGKHLEFQPRCALANYLAQHYPIHAATDISDGLVIDLDKLCRASGVGAELQLGDIPVSWAARNAGADPLAALDRALYDGEDFELLLTCDPATAAQILDDPQLPTPLTQIGWLQPKRGIRGRRPANSGRTFGAGERAEEDVIELPIRGYRHGESA